MRKLTLFITSLFLFVGTAWAQLADGVYTISNTIQNRGTMCFGTKNGTEYFGLADITLGNYGGNSVTVADADVANMHWYVKTVDNKTYIYNVGKGQFLQGQSGNVASCGATCVGFTMSEETHNSTSYALVNSNNQYLAFSCGWQPNQGQIRWTNYEKEACCLTFDKVDGVEATYKTEIGKAIVAINKSVGNYFATPETGKYYKIKGEGELPWLTANTTAGGNVVVSRNEADAAVFLKTANGLQAVATGKYLGYAKGKYTYSDTELAIQLRQNNDYLANYSNKYAIVSGGNYMFNNNNDGIVHESNGQLNLPRLWAFTEVEAPTVAEVNGVKYASFAEAVAAASDGDEIVMLADATLDAETTLPAGVTLNGNGKQINGNLVAGGNLTFKGATKVTSFNAGYNKPVITIGEGACLELTGTGRMVIGHGATFNITGTIANAKTADKATLVPSLKIAAGASITGNGVTFNVKNAYIVANANTTSKNSNANGTLDFNIENSIWEQTGVLAFYVPTSGMDPVVNFELKNSVLTTTSHLVFSVTKGEIVIDNSLVNQGTQRQLENRSTMTIKNGSVVNGAVATSSNAINPGTIIVENATYAVTGEFSGSDLGTGTLIIKKGANVSVGSIKAGANVKVDAEGMAAGDEINFTANLSQFTGTLSVINNDNLNAKVVNGKIVLVERTLAGEGTEASPYLINNIADLKIFRNKVNAGDNYSGKFVKLNADIDLNNEQWEPIGYMGKNFVGNFDGGNFTISNLKVTKELTNAAENNGVGLFGRLDSPATIKNLTIKNATVTGSLYVGAVVGYAYTGKAIENVTVKGDIAINAYWYAGVIGGNGYMNLVNNCHVIGNDGSYIKGNNGSYIGGIWGFRGEGANKITNCTVTNLSIEGVDRVGGISGMAHYGNTISDCAVKNTAVKATDAKATTVGLIAGACQGTTDEPSIITGSTVENVKVTVADSEVVASLYGTNINGTTPVTNYVAKIGANYYESFEAAITAAQAGQTVSILKAGTYALKVKDGITITGAVAGVEFANIGAFGCNGANVTFNNVTFTYAENSTYKGLQHSGNLVYNNCTFNGQVFLYGESETFNKCTFNTTDSNNYNVWTYGAKNVAFNECTFNSAGKSVLIYNESASVTNNVTVTKSTFKASQAVEGKAAIEMDSSLSGAINLTIDSETTAEGFAAGNVSGNSLWNNKKGNKDVANNDITVKVGDETVLAPAPIVVYYQDGTNEVFYDMLKAVPYTSNYPKLEGATIKLLADVAASGLRFMENNMVFDLNGHTYTITAGTGSQGTNTSGFQIRPEVTTDVTFKNGTIKVAEGAPVVYMFNNYATNFILEDVTVDCANMAWSYGNSCYVVVSRGNATTTGARNVEFKGNTTIANFNSIVAGTAYSIDGTMTVGENVECGGSFKLAAGATLTAKEGLNVETVDGYILAYNNGVYATISTTANVATKAELQAALANDNIKTIVLTADIDYGTTQLAITKAITLDLGGYTLTTANAYGGMSIKNNPTVKNGTIVHASNTAAIKVWNATAFEDLVIDVQGKGDANKTIGGIVLQSGSTTKVGSIKNVTIKGAALTNGIETYNCGDATEKVIGSMESVTIDAKGTGLLISAPCGTATNCDIKGGVNAVEIFIKGNYSASLDLVGSKVEGGVYAHDEINNNPGIVNNGTLKFTADEATTGASAADVTLTLARAEENVQGVLKEIVETAKAKVNNTYYATLTDAIAAAKAGDTVIVFEGTYAMPSVKAGITIVGEGNVVFEGTLTGSLENLTMKNIHIKGGNAQRWAYAKGDLVFENVTFEATSVYALHFDGIAAGTNLTYKDCTIIGWAALGGSPASCVFEGCTIKGNGTYGLIRTYFATTIKDCTFDVSKVNTNDVYQDGIHAVEGAIVTVDNCTNANGEMADIVNIHATSVVVLDGVEIKNVAKIGDTNYWTLQDAINAATEGATVTVLTDIALSETVTVPDGKTITLDLNGKTISQEKACTASYEMICNKGNLTITGEGKISFKDTSAGDPSYGWGSYTVRNEGTLVVENGTIEHLGEQTAHMYCAIFQYSGKSTINGGTISTPNYRSARLWKGEMTVNGGNFEGQLWVQAVDNTSNLVIKGGTFAPRGNDGSSVFVTNSTYDVALAVTGGTFETKIGCSDATKLAGAITGGTFSATAKENTVAALIATGYVFGEADANGYYTIADDPATHYIATLDELKAFRDDVNSGANYYAGVTVYLAADIDMAGENWVGIGSATKDHGFMGNFDGQGYKIKNLTITNPALDSDGYAYAGLFGVTEGTDKNNQNTIKNLTIENVTITTTGHIAAAAIAYPYYTIVDNVKVCGNIAIQGGDYTAGVLAYTRRCVNASNLAIVGNDGSFVKGNQVVGGVISDIQMNGGLTAVYNNFSAEGLTVTGAKNVGGISGIIATQTLNGATVKNVALECGNASAGSVSGALGGTSTISNVTVENVTGATALLGTTYNGGAIEAKIGDTYYATLANAVAAAKVGENITMLAPVTVAAGETLTLDKDVTITYTSNVAGEDMITNRGTLNISAGTLTYVNTDATASNVTVSTISSEPGSVLNITGGTVENKTVKADGSSIYSYAIDMLTNGNLGDVTATIAGGTVYSDYMAIRQFNNGTACKNSLTINGGYIYGAKRAVQVHLNNNAAYTTISGGKVEAGADGYAICNFAATGNLEVTGGEFIGAVYSARENFISGGTYNNPVEAAYCAEGYMPNKNTDGTYGVVAAQDAVAAVGGFAYATLAEAVKAAKAGETITLLQNVKENVTINKNLTIDGADKTITGMITTDGKSLKVTIKNVKFDGNNKTVNYAMRADDDLNLVVENCSVKGYLYGFLYANKSNDKIVVKNVTVENCASYGAYLVSFNSASFENFKVSGARNGILVDNSSARKVNLKNVKFKGVETPLATNDKGTSIVTFAFDGINDMSKEEFYTSKYVEVIAEAQVGTKVCGSLQDAVDAANDGETVKLLGDLNMTTANFVTQVDGYATLVNVAGKAVTIDLNGKKVTVNAAHADLNGKAKGNMLMSVFHADPNGTLTLTDSSAEGTGTVELFANDAKVYSFIVSENSGDKTQSGKIVVNGGNYIADNLFDSMIYADTDEVITVNGGNFHLDNTGTSTNGKPWIFNTLGANQIQVLVNGGTYNTNIGEQYYRDEFKLGNVLTIRDNGNDTWSVVTGVTLVDGEFTEYTNDKTQEVEYISYTRTMSTDWNAFYVPFEVPVSLLAEQGFEVAYINGVRRSDYDENGVLDDKLNMELIMIHGGKGNADGTSKVLKANYPYFVRAKGDEKKVLTIELTDVTLYAAENVTYDCSTFSQKFEITGNASQVYINSSENAIVYGVNTIGQWTKITKGSNLKPFRFFMTVTNRDGSAPTTEEAPAMMSIAIRGEELEDGTTIIYDVEMDGDRNADYIFDLQGRRVLEPQKGNLYIINGKKVIF